MDFKLIIGHANMDLDCLGSMILAKYLFPDHNLVQSRHLHPAAKNLFNLYRYNFNALQISDIKGKSVSHMIIMDTSRYDRVKEFFTVLESPHFPVEIYDHHEGKDSDFPHAVIFRANTGSNTTILCLKVIEQKIHISREDATIALAGIYADTGYFTHDNVTPQDLEAAAFLLSAGADLSIVRHALDILKEDHQVTLFHEVLASMEKFSVLGHRIGMAEVFLPEQKSGLAAVVEKAFDTEHVHALFCVFHIQKDNSALIIARSGRQCLDLPQILSDYDGQGHPQAASAQLKKGLPENFRSSLISAIVSKTPAAMTVSDFMSPELVSVSPQMSLKDASMKLEQANVTGAPVLDAEGLLAGVLTLRNIMKGRKSQAMNAPVSAYMTRNPITIGLFATVDDVEHLFYTHDIGHIPVLDGLKVAGIVTRSDYLKVLHNL
jgi:tRNA nucleotidyltransferase (CCA-adding enzyme)